MNEKTSCLTDFTGPLCKFRTRRPPFERDILIGLDGPVSRVSGGRHTWQGDSLDRNIDVTPKRTRHVGPIRERNRLRRHVGREQSLCDGIRRVDNDLSLGGTINASQRRISQNSRHPVYRFGRRSGAQLRRYSRRWERTGKARLGIPPIASLCSNDAPALAKALRSLAPYGALAAFSHCR